MSLVPSHHPRFAWLRTGLFGGAGRGGPARLVAIAAALAAMAGAVYVFSGRHSDVPLGSRVARMAPGNLLPGGTQGTPAQDALLKKDSQEKALAAAEAHKSYTPPIPSSTAFTGPPPAEVGMGESPAPDPPAAKPVPPPPSIVPPAPPVFTPPERAALEPPPGERRFDGARVTKIAATNVEGDETAEEARGAYQRRQKAIADLLGGWNARPPQTTVVIEPAALKPGPSDPPAIGDRAGVRGAEGAVGLEKVLVPAGRGVYAHTVLAVDSDTNGPIVLEADTGPISGDRLIGTFSKSGLDRLVVKVLTVEHRGKSLDANGIVIAPDSMETAVATSIDEHYFERFVLPAAAAFVSGLGQAVALSNSTTTTSPWGTTQSFGPLTVQQQALVAGGAAASAVSNAMTSSIPKGPTVHLAANVSVGVMFLSNLTAK